MMALVDTSVLVDHLRGRSEAVAVLRSAREAGLVHASEITRLELLVDMRAHEEAATRRLIDHLVWHDVDEAVAEKAGAFGRRWRPSHHPIDAADLAIAATAALHGLRLVTLNVKHFPMFPGLDRPY